MSEPLHVDEWIEIQMGRETVALIEILLHKLEMLQATTLQE